MVYCGAIDWNDFFAELGAKHNFVFKASNLTYKNFEELFSVLYLYTKQEVTE
jgi:hypothetical protein